MEGPEWRTTVGRLVRTRLELAWAKATKKPSWRRAGKSGYPDSLVAPTYKFGTPADLADHFQKHRVEVGATSEAEYEAKAAAFLGGQRGQHTLQCTRKDGALLRYNPITGEFGVLANGLIKTYFKPFMGRPAMAAHYFQVECQR
jgi:hypothetical protein